MKASGGAGAGSSAGPSGGAEAPDGRVRGAMGAVPRSAWIRGFAVLGFACRLAVGGTFLATGAAKFIQPAAFVRAVEAYQLLPDWAVVPVAALLAAAEPLLGAALLLGLRLDLVCPALGGLTLLFMGAIASAVMRGLTIDCGCSFLSERAGWAAVARDGALLLGLGVAWWQRGGGHKSRRGGGQVVRP
ncbi:MAG: hypothetical protein K6T75_04425 [Acetobacteraceae bacterium]|nr:hypothetical protein [Acetobacteraceae bacterium]